MREMKSYRELLRKRLGTDYDSAVKSYDVIGSIAVINERGAKGRAVAESIMEVNKGVKTVLAKAGAVKGRYRKRGFVLVSGKRNYIADYKENGISLRFDVRRTFFSTRLAYERNRIAGLSKDGEVVLVMFAGAGPFAIEIAKRHKKSKVYAVELNRYSYRYMLDNIKLNKTTYVIPVLGDVKKAVPKLGIKADRIIMPLPMKAHEFLGTALDSASQGAVIHYYAFGNSDDPYSESISRIKESASAHGLSISVIGRRIVRPYSSRMAEVAIDFRVGKRIRKKK